MSVAWGWALRRWRRKEWTPPPDSPIRKYIRWKRQFRRGSCSQVGRSRRTPAPLCQRQKKPKDKSARAEKRGGKDQKSSRLKFTEGEGGTAENVAEPSLKRNSPSHRRLPQEVKPKQSVRSFTRKSSIRMLMQPPSAARKPELPPASRQQRQQTPLRRKRKRRCRRSSCSIKLCGSVLVWVSCW